MACGGAGGRSPAGWIRAGGGIGADTAGITVPAAGRWAQTAQPEPDGAAELRDAACDGALPKGGRPAP